MATKTGTTYQDRQRAARLACAGAVMLDPSSSEDDRVLAERDLTTNGGDTSIDFALLARERPEFFAGLARLYQIAQRDGMLTSPPREIAAVLATAPRPMGVVAPDPDDSDPDA